MNERDVEAHRAGRPPRGDRVALGALGIGVVVALVGGALLFSHVLGIAATNRGLICAFGTALAQTKVQQRAEETPREFQARVTTTRAFLATLHDLQECEPPTPLTLKIAPRDRDVLGDQRKRRQQERRTEGEPPLAGGGDELQSGSSNPGQQPGPPPGGSGSGGRGGGDPPEPRPDEGPLDPVVEAVCEIDAPGGLDVCPPG